MGAREKILRQMILSYLLCHMIIIVFHLNFYFRGVPIPIHNKLYSDLPSHLQERIAFFEAQKLFDKVMLSIFVLL